MLSQKSLKNLGKIVNFGYSSGSIPYSWNNEDTKLILSRNKSFRLLLYFFNVSFVWIFTPYIVIKYIYYINHSGNLLASFAILMCVILCIFLSISHYNTLNKFYEIPSAFNVVLKFVLKEQANPRLTKILEYFFTQFWLSGGLGYILCALSIIMAKSSKVSLGVFASSGFPMYMNQSCLLRYIPIGLIAYQMLTLTVNLLIYVTFFLIICITLPPAVTNVLRRSKSFKEYRSVQLLIYLVCDSTEYVLPGFFGITVLFSIIINFTSLGLHRFILLDNMENLFGSATTLIWFILPFLTGFSVTQIIILKLTLGQLAKFQKISESWKNLSSQNQTKYFKVLLRSCRPIKFKIGNFGYVQGSTFINALTVILDNTILLVLSV